MQRKRNYNDCLKGMHIFVHLFFTILRHRKSVDLSLKMLYYYRSMCEKEDFYGK